ncbi:hypothetical protein AO724_12540 [Aeromonas allosaccharophila]|nr:hypothetical protein AO724_12540 [Aeromonas allosaccharophila]
MDPDTHVFSTIIPVISKECVVIFTEEQHYMVMAVNRSIPLPAPDIGGELRLPLSSMAFVIRSQLFLECFNKSCNHFRIGAL